MRYIFGHRSDPDDIETKEDALHYLSKGLPEEERFRYRSTYNVKQLDSIIFSFDGELLGELVVGDVLAPTDEDTQLFNKTRAVYLIDEIRLFRVNTFRTSDFDLVHSQYGTKVPDDVYAEILRRVGGFEQVIKNQQ